MPGPTVSIIVPTYNRAAFLPECLDSLLAQTFPSIEIIVVNDGSTDDTASVLGMYRDRVNYLEKENGGKSSCLNHVLPRITGDYVWIFDDDDVALPEAIETQVNVLQSNPGVGFACAAAYLGRSGSDGRIQRGALQPLPEVSPDEFFVKLLEGWFLTGQAALLVRTQCYNEVGPFDTRLVRSQDYDMLLRLSRRYRGVSINSPIYIYRVHSNLRGSGKHRFPGELRNAHWYNYDKIIFDQIYRDVDLAEYLPTNQPLNDDSHRQALFQRMSVMARKGLWNPALDDLAQLLHNFVPDKQLSAREKQLCRIAMDRKYAIQDLLQNWYTAAVLMDLCWKPQGTAIRYEFARGLYYLLEKEVRAGNYYFAGSVWYYLTRLLGYQGALEAIKFKLGLPSDISS